MLNKAKEDEEVCGQKGGTRQEGVEFAKKEGQKKWRRYQKVAGKRGQRTGQITAAKKAAAVGQVCCMSVGIGSTWLTTRGEKHR